MLLEEFLAFVSLFCGLIDTATLQVSVESSAAISGHVRPSNLFSRINSVINNS